MNGLKASQKGIHGFKEYIQTEAPLLCEFSSSHTSMWESRT